MNIICMQMLANERILRLLNTEKEIMSTIKTMFWTPYETSRVRIAASTVPR